MVDATILIGRRVVTSDAYVLGDVHGLEVDPEKWVVTHLRIRLTKESGKDLRFKKPVFGDVIVCIPVNLVKALGDVINLNVSFTEVASLSECQ